MKMTRNKMFIGLVIFILLFCALGYYLTARQIAVAVVLVGAIVAVLVSI